MSNYVDKVSISSRHSLKLPSGARRFTFCAHWYLSTTAEHMERSTHSIYIAWRRNHPRGEEDGRRTIPHFIGYLSESAFYFFHFPLSSLQNSIRKEDLGLTVLWTVISAVFVLTHPLFVHRCEKDGGRIMKVDADRQHVEVMIEKARAEEVIPHTLSPNFVLNPVLTVLRRGSSHDCPRR